MLLVFNLSERGQARKDKKCPELCPQTSFARQLVDVYVENRMSRQGKLDRLGEQLTLIEDMARELRRKAAGLGAI
jgi:hypothetical protein